MIEERDVAGDEPLVDDVGDAGKRLAPSQHRIKDSLRDAGADGALTVFAHVGRDAQVTEKDGRGVHPGDGLDTIYQGKVIVKEMSGEHCAGHLPVRVQHRRTGNLRQARAALPGVEGIGVRFRGFFQGDVCLLRQTNLR